MTNASLRRQVSAKDATNQILHKTGLLSLMDYSMLKDSSGKFRLNRTQVKDYQKKC